MHGDANVADLEDLVIEFLDKKYHDTVLYTLGACNQTKRKPSEAHPVLDISSCQRHQAIDVGWLVGVLLNIIAG